MNHIARSKAWILNLLSALGSALVLSLIYANSGYWFLAPFALIPFLCRLCRNNAAGSITLAVFLATFFVSINKIISLAGGSPIVIFEFICLYSACIVFACGVNRIKRLLGFDLLAIALLWFPLEYILISFANHQGIFSISEPGSKIVIGSFSLSGMILVSLIVVLINALLIRFFRYVNKRMRGASFFSTIASARTYPRLSQALVGFCLYCISGTRSPPIPEFSIN